MKPDDICPRPDRVPPQPTEPMAAPIYPSAVYRCTDPQQAEQLMSGELPGHVYVRDGHPNADVLAEKCRELHGADRAAVCASGMSALAAAALALVEAGDHVVLSNGLYGRSEYLFATELARLGIAHAVADACDVAAIEAAIEPRTRLIVVETITNPMLRVADLERLAEVAHRRGARLLVDNTFAGPIVCRPLGLGADVVVESLTKMMSGHSDVMLGLVCGRDDVWQRVPEVLKTWGLGGAPMECWLAARGLGTFAVRCERGCSNAATVARFLEGDPRVESTSYPGLASHPDHATAKEQFGDRFGAMVTFTLAGGTAAATAFVRAAAEIPFSPSLGDLSTTLSHPESTSHHGLSAAERAARGIFGGTIRLSLGIESVDTIVERVHGALRSMG